MRFSAFDNNADLIATNEFFSIGGGFVVNEKTEVTENVFFKDSRVDHVKKVDPGQLHVENVNLGRIEPQSASATPTGIKPNTKGLGPPGKLRVSQKLLDAALPFHDGVSLLKICEQKNLTIAQVVYQNELKWRSGDEIKARTLSIWNAMNASVINGMTPQDQFLPGPLRGISGFRGDAFFKEQRTRSEL